MLHSTSTIKGAQPGRCTPIYFMHQEIELVECKQVEQSPRTKGSGQPYMPHMSPMLSPQQPSTPSEAFSSERKRKRPADGLFPNTPAPTGAQVHCHHLPAVKSWDLFSGQHRKLLDPSFCKPSIADVAPDLDLTTCNLQHSPLTLEGQSRMSYCNTVFCELCAQETSNSQHSFSLSTS